MAIPTAGMIVTSDVAGKVETVAGDTVADSPVPGSPAAVVTLVDSATWVSGGLIAVVVTLLVRAVVSPWTTVNSEGWPDATLTEKEGGSPVQV